MKRSNGEGSITTLKGNHRKKKWARVSVGNVYDEKQDKIVRKQKSLGVYKTTAEAQRAIDEYFANPFEVMSRQMTMQEAFMKLYDLTAISNPNYAKDLMSHWRYCSAIHSMKITEVKTIHMVRFLDSNPYYFNEQGEKVYASPNTLMRIKSILNQIFDLATAESIVSVNLARNFKIDKKIRHAYEEQHQGHIPFDLEELKILKENLDYPFADMIYVNIYMGWRPAELVELKIEDVHFEEGFIIGGKKTSNGYRRTVPIHTEILPILKKYYHLALTLQSEFLFNDAGIHRKSTVKKNLSTSNYSYRFRCVLSALHLDSTHRPHDARTTFATIAKISGIDSFAIKKIMGHSTKNDVTEHYYTNPDFSWYYEQMQKFQYGENA